jgi:hypothetical protein
VHWFDLFYWRRLNVAGNMRTSARCEKKKKKKKKKKKLDGAAASARQIVAPAKNRKEPRCATPHHQCFTIHLSRRALSLLKLTRTRSRMSDSILCASAHSRCVGLQSRGLDALQAWRQL